MTLSSIHVRIPVMRVSSWAVSDTGLRRGSNQDSYGIEEDLGVYIVADGMGGHSGGEVASSLAVESVRQVIREKSGKFDPRNLLNEAYLAASNRIFDMAQNERPELTGMGTTMVMVYVHDSKVYIANVGDSRCYLFRAPNLWQLTEDHSLINEQLRMGLLSEGQIEGYVGRNVITRSVGYEREAVPDVLERQANSGEMYLLCSDGLSGLVEDFEIENILKSNPPERACKLCVELALANGGDDNVTVVIVRID